MGNLVSIDSIIDSSYKHAYMCKDILRWHCKTADKTELFKEFDVTELGNWLIKNHKPYIEEYSDSKSHTPPSTRLHSKRTYITDRLRDLIQVNLVKTVGTTKCSKNSFDKHLFCFTLQGSFIAWLVYARAAEDDTTRSRAIDRLFTTMTANLFFGNFPFGIFMIEFLNKCTDEDVRSSLIEHYESLTSLIIDIDLRQARQLFMASGCLNLKIGKVFHMVFSELDKEIQRLLLFQFKMDIEFNDTACLMTNPINRLSGSREIIKYLKGDALRKWELMRYRKIQDYSRVTLLGFCISCRVSYPFQMDILKFMDLRDTFTLILKPDQESSYYWQRIDCRKCGKKRSLLIFPTWLNTKGKNIGVFRD
jgi:hypothetical protein